MYPSSPSTPSSYASRLSHASYSPASRPASEPADGDRQVKRSRISEMDEPSSPSSTAFGGISPVSLTSVSGRSQSSASASVAGLVPMTLFPWDEDSEVAAAAAPVSPAGPVAPVAGSADHLHEEAVDVYVDGERVVTRACFVARDADLGAHQNHTLTCEPVDGFSGLYAEDIGSDLVLAMLPPEGMQGLVFLRHTAARGEALIAVAQHMTLTYPGWRTLPSGEAVRSPGRFVVAYATGPLWVDLDQYRQARQAAGETLDQLVDGLIEEHGLDLPLSQPALAVPGSAPPMPAGERLREVGELMALEHAAHANALAAAFGGEAVELTHAAVFASWDGNLLDFVGEPEAEFVDAPVIDSSDDAGDDSSEDAADVPATPATPSSPDSALADDEADDAAPSSGVPQRR